MISEIDGVSERVLRMVLLKHGTILDKRIKFYSQNTNLLPPKPKSSFRHLKQGIKEFHIESMSWFQRTRPQTM